MDQLPVNFSRAAPHEISDPHGPNHTCRLLANGDPSTPSKLPDLHSPHKKKVKYETLSRLWGSEAPTREFQWPPCEREEKRFSQVKITMVRSLLHTGYSISIFPIGQPHISLLVDPLSTLTLYWVHFPFWAHSTLLRINISHTNHLIGRGGKEYDYAFPLSTVE